MASLFFWIWYYLWMLGRRVTIGLLLLAVLVLAGWFRLYDIQNYPGGLFPDEAANGEDALLILDGDIRPFYPRGNGREGLYFYLEAVSIKYLGVGVWQLHLVSAVIGWLTVLAMYFATRIWFGRLAGLLAALFLATSHWHVTLSRTGFRAILIPLFIALVTALVGYTVASVRAKKMGLAYFYAALAGAALAGGFYTYIAYRVMIGVVGGIVVLLLLAAIHPKIGFPHWRRYGNQLAIGMVAGLIVFAPLLWHFSQNPADIVGRAGQVSVFNKELQEEFGGGTLAGTIYFSVRETVMSGFAGSGDLNWRHNVAGFPLLNPLVGMLFILGLAWALRGTWLVFRRIIAGTEVSLGMIYPYLLLLLGGMLLPVITTAEGLPHGLRSIGLIAPIFILAGSAGAVVVHWCRRRAAQVYWGVWCSGVVVGLVLLGVFYDGALYFMVARNSAEAHYDYRADLTEVAKYIQFLARQDGGSNTAAPYLTLDKFSLQTTHFLLSAQAHGYLGHPESERHAYQSVDPGDVRKLDLGMGDVVIFTQSYMVEADQFAREYPAAALSTDRYNKFGEEIMRVYEMKDQPAVEGVRDSPGDKQDGLDA